MKAADRRRKQDSSSSNDRARSCASTRTSPMAWTIIFQPLAIVVARVRANQNCKMVAATYCAAYLCTVRVFIQLIPIYSS